MAEKKFRYKSYCQLSITSRHEGLDAITQKLNINPDKFYAKGDVFKSKHSCRTGLRPQSFWAIQSKSIDSEDESILTHLKYFESLLKTKIDVLREFKDSPFFEVKFLIWMETDNGGVGVDLKEEYLDFLNKIVNKIHFTFISGEQI